MLNAGPRCSQTDVKIFRKCMLNGTEVVSLLAKQLTARADSSLIMTTGPSRPRTVNNTHFGLARQFIEFWPPFADSVVQLVLGDWFTTEQLCAEPIQCPQVSSAAQQRRGGNAWPVRQIVPTSYCLVPALQPDGKTFKHSSKFVVHPDSNFLQRNYYAAVG